MDNGNCLHLTFERHLPRVPDVPLFYWGNNAPTSVGAGTIETVAVLWLNNMALLDNSWSSVVY